MPRLAHLPPLAGVTALVLGSVVFSPSMVRADEVVVFAAASLTNALADIEKGFEAATGNDLVVSLAASSALARQIEQGAPADVFISASSEWMDTLEDKGLIENATRFDLLANSIVLIAHDPAAKEVEIGPTMDLKGLLGDGKLAMALVDSVPAGIYGKASLENFGLWDSVKDQVAQADNVRAALKLVASGEAPYGIVYATDAVAEKGVTVIGGFPTHSHPPILYPAAVLKGRELGAADEFLDYLAGPEARAAFERQGFIVMAK